MTKTRALHLIDGQINVSNSEAMINWIWLRAVVASISDDEWEKLIIKAAEIILK